MPHPGASVTYWDSQCSYHHGSTTSLELCTIFCCIALLLSHNLILLSTGYELNGEMCGLYEWIMRWPSVQGQVSNVIAIAHKLIPWIVSDCCTICCMLPVLQLLFTLTQELQSLNMPYSSGHKKQIACLAARIHRLSLWQVISIVVFKNGQFRDLYNWHNLTYSYWPIWVRQLGCMLQILPLILVPLGCIVQTWRYLSGGPPDILDVSVDIFTLIICPVLYCLHFCSYFTAFLSPSASFLPSSWLCLRLFFSSPIFFICHPYA